MSRFKSESNKMSKQKNNKPLQIEKEDKFFTRLLSKESSMANPSSRVLYYADRPGSIPFLWESQPGTPKNNPTFRNRDKNDDNFCLNTTFDGSPLTPPPSYNPNNNNNIKSKPKKFFAEKIKFEEDHHHHHQDQHHRRDRVHKRCRSSNLLGLIFPKGFNFMGLIKVKPIAKRTGLENCSMLDSATFRSGSTTTVSWISSSSSSFDSRRDNEEEEELEVGFNDNDDDDDDDDNEVSRSSTICFGCYRL